MKAIFTRSTLGVGASGLDANASRRKHRESDVWQRRFWEHVIEDETDLEHHLNYLHFNPVKHGLVSCPHLWPYSSFSRWVRAGLYPEGWGCRCGQRRSVEAAVVALDGVAGE